MTHEPFLELKQWSQSYPKNSPLIAIFFGIDSSRIYHVKQLILSLSCDESGFTTSGYCGKSDRLCKSNQQLNC